MPSPADTGEGRARLYPSPAVNQSWVDADGDVIRIIDVDTEGFYPIKFMWDDGAIGRMECDIRGFEPTPETWLEHVATLTRERDEARADLVTVREQLATHACKSTCAINGHGKRDCAKDAKHLGYQCRCAECITALAAPSPGGGA